MTVSLPLRRLLFADAATCAVFGGLLALAPQTIAGPTALPPGLLLTAGLALLPVSAFIAWIASRAAIPAIGVRIVVAGNLMWVAASAGLLLPGWIDPTPLGTAFVAVQALAVALLAGLEHAALRALHAAA